MSLLRSHNWKWTERADIKIGYRTHLDLQYAHTSQNRGYDRMMRSSEPSILIEIRWPSDFQNKFRVSYERSETTDGRIQDVSNNWKSQYDIIWRKRDLLFIRRLEFRQMISGTRLRTEGFYPRKAYTLASGTSLDLYPVHSLILRMQVDFTRYWDRLVFENDYTEVTLNLKASLRF
jgi:hypothetical protein